MVKTIKIRGHHLRSLRVMMQKGTTNIVVSREWPPSFGGDLMAYTPEMALLYKNIYKAMIENPKLKVEITYSLDDICSICPKKNSKCREVDADRYVANKYGLVENRVYSFKEIIDKLKSNT